MLLDVDTTRVTVKHGTLSGHVLRADGATPVAGAAGHRLLPNNSQPGVMCPPLKSEQATGMRECPIDRHDRRAGRVRVRGDLRRPPSRRDVRSGDAAAGRRRRRCSRPTATVERQRAARRGLGTVHGIVLDAAGQPVAGARVGGGLSLTTTDANGRFMLTRRAGRPRAIVAVSDRLGARGNGRRSTSSAPGEEVNATIVLARRARLPARSSRPTAPRRSPTSRSTCSTLRDGDGINVVGTAITNANGGTGSTACRCGDYTCLGVQRRTSATATSCRSTSSSTARCSQPT